MTYAGKPSSPNQLILWDGTKFYSGLISDANIASSATISGTKVTANFGSQTVQTTGGVVSGLYTLGSGGPSITAGTGVPATTVANGSIFLRTDGTSASGVYTYQSGVWSPITGGGGGGGGGSPTGSAGGDLASTYPSPTVAKIQGIPVSAAVPADGYVLTYNAGANQWAPKYTFQFDPQNYGAVYDDPSQGLNNLIAINRMMTAIKNTPAGAAKIQIKSVLYLSDTFFIDAPITFLSSGVTGENASGPSKFIFPANCEGLRLLGYGYSSLINEVSIQASGCTVPMLWKPGQAYVRNNLVRCPFNNKYIFRCIIPGTSGSTIPSLAEPNAITPRRFSPATQYLVGDYVFPGRTTAAYGKYMLHVTRCNGSTVAGTAGVAGLTEPTWPAVGGTVVSDQVEFTAVSFESSDPNLRDLWQIPDNTRPSISTGATQTSSSTRTVSFTSSVGAVPIRVSTTESLGAYTLSTITITGTDASSVSQTDTVTILKTKGGEALYTNKEFLTVTSISIPAMSNTAGVITVEAQTLAWMPESISGVVQHVPASLVRLIITGFSCCGIIQYSALTDPALAQASVDASYIDQCTISGVGCGIYVKGFNANGNSCSNCFVVQCGINPNDNQLMPGYGGVAYEDNSLLGYIWTNCLTETSAGSGFISAPLGNSVYINCYSDGNYLPAIFQNGAILLNGVDSGSSVTSNCTVLGTRNAGGALNTSTPADIHGKYKLYASVFPFNGTSYFPISSSRDRDGADYTAYHVDSFYQGIYLKTNKIGNSVHRYITGFTTNRSTLGRGNEWNVNGQYRGSSTNPYYYGYDGAFATEKNVRFSRRVPGDRWVSNTAPAPGQFINKITMTAGTVGVPWSAGMLASTYQTDTGIAATTVVDTFGYSYSCVKGGTTGGTTPFTVQNSTVGPIAQVWVPNTQVWPGDLFKPTSDGYNKYLQVTQYPQWTPNKPVKPGDFICPSTANGQVYETYYANVPSYPAKEGRYFVGDIFQPSVGKRYSDGYCLQIVSVVDRGNFADWFGAQGETGPEPATWTNILGDTQTVVLGPGYSITWKVIQLRTGTTEPPNWASSQNVQITSGIQAVLDNNIFWQYAILVTGDTEPTWNLTTPGVSTTVDVGSPTVTQAKAVPFTFTYVNTFNTNAFITDNTVRWMRTDIVPTTAVSEQVINPGTLTKTASGTVALTAYEAHYQTIKTTNATTLSLSGVHIDGNHYRVYNAGSLPLAVTPGSVTIPPGTTYDMFSDGTNLLAASVSTQVVPALPSALSGLLLWTRSDQGVTQSGTVSAWADLSGNGNNFTQATSGQRPVYNASDMQYNGFPSFTFDGSNDVLISGSLTMGPFTRILVMRQTVAGYLLEFGGLDYEYGPDPTGLYTTRGGVTSSYNAGTNWSVSTTPKVIVHRFDGTHVGNTLRINGVQQSMLTFGGLNSDPGTATFTHTMGLFGSSTGTGATAAGTVAEVIIFNRALTTTETLRIEAYLQSRYYSY